VQTIGLACVRIQGGMSSFSIPDEPADHPVWIARYGNKPRSPYAYQLFRRERIALQRHATSAGIRMIIGTGLDLDVEYGTGVTRTRLCLLAQFIESIDLAHDRVQLVLVERRPPQLTVAVGNWFFAESFAARPVRGVLHTVFTTHAPTVTRRVTEFDHDLASLLARQGTPPERSRTWVLERLKDRIRTLPSHPAWTCQPQ
jgi:hypothetical protein